MVAGNDDGVAYVLRLPDFKLMQTVQANQTVRGAKKSLSNSLTDVPQLITSVAFIPQSNECKIGAGECDAGLTS